MLQLRTTLIINQALSINIILDGMYLQYKETQTFKACAFLPVALAKPVCALTSEFKQMQLFSSIFFFFSTICGGGVCVRVCGTLQQVSRSLRCAGHGDSEI